MNTPNPHLDDDVLSAVIDGEATPSDSAHVTACDECHHRLGHLRAAAAAAAAVPMPEPETRERAVEAALAAWERAPRTGRREDEVTPLRRARRPRPLVLSVAALAAAIVVVAGVASLIGTTDDDQFAATGGDAGERVAGTDAGFLGAFDDDRDLARQLSSHLAVPEPQPQDAESAAGDGETLSGSGGGGVADGQGAVGDQRAVAEPAPPPAGSIARLGDEAMEACSTMMLEEYPDAGERLLVGRIVWHDEPAAVFVHRLEGGERGLRAFVYAGDPCRLRTFISF